MTYKSTIASTIRLQGENSRNISPVSGSYIASTIRLQGENSSMLMVSIPSPIASTIRLQGENSGSIWMNFSREIASTIRLQGENSAWHYFFCFFSIASTIRLQGENSHTVADGFQRQLQAQFVCKVQKYRLDSRQDSFHKSTISLYNGHSVFCIAFGIFITNHNVIM